MEVVDHDLHVRWLGRVRYGDAQALQTAIFEQSQQNYLLMLEHPSVYTLGVRAKLEHVLVPPAEVGAELVKANRGGDVTYHGPGQLVGYPLLSIATRGVPSTAPEYVASVEQLVIDSLHELGLTGADRLPGCPGVWVGVGTESPRKIAAIGVRMTRGRTMHGFALNVSTDMSYFDHIVPCGITDKGVTSLAAEGIDVSMREVVDLIAKNATALWRFDNIDRADAAWKVAREEIAPFTLGEGAGGTSVRMLGRLSAAGVDSSTSVQIRERKPDWMVVKAKMGDEYRSLKKTMRSLDLVTVCEEAGCPNIFDCWNDGTATFMINGERCTRKCGFCLVDTQKPMPLDASEPQRVAEATKKMNLSHVVVTTVARDDLDDGGAGAFAETIAAIRRTSPGTNVEVLISDCKGENDSLNLIYDARPDVLNHNIETVARLQRAVRPSASYARSLSVLGRAKAKGLVVKSGLIVGMGESMDEIIQTLADLRAAGVDIVTVGQYLRPTSNHLPVARWYTPDEFDNIRVVGEAMGFAHVQSSPLTRSSYHARSAAEAATTSTPVTLARPS